MRGLRWLLLLAISVVLATVGTSYYIEKARQAREAPPPPAELPANIAAESETWVHTQYDGDRAVVEVRARKMRQIREPSEFELEGVELRIFEEGGYDRVRSALARFDIEKGLLYSEGEVEIALDVPNGGGVPEAELVKIRSSGVRFETKTGKATTDRPTSFHFSHGEGRSVGATYDPGWKDLRMHSDAELLWYPAEPGGEAMVVEAGQLVYKEDHDKVYLSPWSRFRKGPLTLEAADSVVSLEDGAIRQVDAQQARGGSNQAGRRTEYEAESLNIRFAADTTIEQITGWGQARILAHGPDADTEVEADRIVLAFRVSDGESILDHALAMGNGRLESRPKVRRGRPTPPSRVLRSEIIKALMWPDGQEVHIVETQAPGIAELIPNDPSQSRRRLDGERITIEYAAGNRIETLRATKAETRTEEPLGEGEKSPPMLTWSDDLAVRFDPDSGETKEIEQWGRFRYREGGRQARAERALFDSSENRIVLMGGARVWDEQGSTAADMITMDQANGIFTAKGQVTSSRQPDSGSPASGSVLQAREPLHATAEQMTSNAGGGFISYEGKAVLWQGADRLHADKVDIDREHGVLTATGKVINQFADRREQGAGDKDTSAALSYTVVRAGELTYAEEHHAAIYRHNVRLTQPGLEIHSQELRAYFKDGEAGAPGGGGGNLDYALADGDVRIKESSGDRIRTGSSEHAEYYLDEDKVVLTGGRPKMVDSVRGATQGSRLTYFARDDRLQVDGAETRPSVSRLNRK